MDFSPTDILTIVVLVWIVIEILNDSNWGGGRRIRNNDWELVPAECRV